MNSTDKILSAESNVNERMQALFELRNDQNNRKVIEDALINGLCKSVLYRHEVAFVLGQMGLIESVPLLEKVLRDTTDNAVVRHESAEAIAAIITKNYREEDKNFEKALALFKEYKEDVKSEVSETCKIAEQQLLKLKTMSREEIENAFNTIDPAVPLDEIESKENRSLEEALNDETSDLFRRYQVLFTLRNNEDLDSTNIISNALNTDKSSALFRHEIAYVLGQIDPKLHSQISVRNLISNLSNLQEHEMVRHESAEALGSIVENKELEAECSILSTLKKFSHDKKQLVKESCELALSAAEYWENFNN
eukprot:augustus_masked-scaffold_14-processed-gene-1.41-mRNA-1 protein AED:0.24 eAED:0.24 QI:0/-1/0/1/-1/1/1/0/308